MLLADQGLYTIDSFLYEKNSSIHARISLQEAHEIFKGHFPGQPVLPGVCMLQISQELLEHALEQRLMMYQTGQVKFLRMVQPATTPVIQVHIQLKEGLEHLQIAWTDESQQSILKYTASYRIV